MSVHISTAYCQLVTTHYVQSWLGFFTSLLKSSSKCSSLATLTPFLICLWASLLSARLIMLFTSGLLASLSPYWVLLPGLEEESRVEYYLLGVHWWQEHHPRNTDVRLLSFPLTHLDKSRHPSASVSPLTTWKRCSKLSLKFSLPPQVYALAQFSL